MPFTRILILKGMVVLLMGLAVLWTAPDDLKGAGWASSCNVVKCLPEVFGCDEGWINFECSLRCPEYVAWSCDPGGHGECEENEVAYICFAWPD